MVNFRYFALFVVILAALISAIRQMSIALDEVDIEGFTLWTSIASVIAGLPMMLW